MRAKFFVWSSSRRWAIERPFLGLGYTYVARGELAEDIRADTLLKTFSGTTL